LRHQLRQQKSREQCRAPGEVVMSFDGKPHVKARSPSACGLIPSIRFGSRYANLSSALR
jgi:hypothetical protein